MAVTRRLKFLSRMAFFALACTLTGAGAAPAPHKPATDPAGASAASGGPAGKENRWAQQIIDTLVVGRPEWLKAKGRRFLALYAQATTDHPKGAVILLHGLGANPDWPEVIHPLRVELPDHGWSTLSIQLPVRPNGVPAKDYLTLFAPASARIQAAVGFLKKRGDTPIVLVGHSLGAAMGAWYLAGHPDTPVRAFAGIGMNASKDHPKLDTPTQLAKIKRPVLDLYGSRDLPGVLRSARARAAAARKAGNGHYRQQQIAGADHFFNGLDDQLVQVVRGWLHTVTKTGAAR